MDGMKVFRLVEYLKSVGFYHDTFDLEDEGVRGILSEYGVHDDFSEAELEELRKDLYEIAEQNEFREAATLTANPELGLVSELGVM